MKYFESGLNCANEKTCFTDRKLSTLKWSVIIAYVALEAAFLALLLDDLRKIDNGDYALIKNYYLWMGLTYLVGCLFQGGSSVFALVGLYKIKKAVDRLRFSNPNIKSNNCLLITHIVLCLLQALLLAMAATLFSLSGEESDKSYYNLQRTLNFGIPVIDLLVQWIICYICATQGASKVLRDVVCTIKYDSRGRAKIEFDIKGTPLPESVDINESSDEDSRDSFNEVLHAARGTTDSEYNRRCCNEIVLQFIEGLDDEYASIINDV
jgi:hypothetical protein